MDTNNKQLISQFKLPLYIQGKSFADASKAISDKFKGRNDMISNNTKNELLKRLADAQEFSKSQEQQVQQEQMAMGGFADSTIGQGFGDDATGEQKNAALGAGINTLVSGIDLAKTAFGKPNIDTSGQTASTDINSGAMIGSNALKGAQAGMAFGPVGAGVGALVRGVAGILGSNKAKKAINENTNNFTTVTNRRLSDNYFAMGGEVNKYDGGGWYDQNNPYFMKNPGLTNQNTVTNNFTKPQLPQDINDPYPSFTIPSTKKDILNYQKNKGFDKKNMDGIIGPYTQKYINSDILRSTPEKIILPIKTDLDITPTQTKAGFEAYADAKQVENAKKDDKSNPLEFLKNNSDLLRYAPAVTNALQLKNLKKPANVTLSKLSNRYRPDYVDLAQQQNIVNQELNNVNSAVQQSGASQGAIRNAMLGAQLNKTKALSNAYMNAEQQNAQQNSIAQQFNLGVDQTNLGQSNLQQDINDRNIGAYDTQKSQLISQIGNDLGGIGKEQLFKQYPKMMGLGYNWNGKYFINDKGDIKTKEDAEKLQNTKANGGFLNSDVLSHINNMYTKRNSK